MDPPSVKSTRGHIRLESLKLQQSHLVVKRSNRLLNSQSAQISKIIHFWIHRWTPISVFTYVYINNILYILYICYKCIIMTNIILRKTEFNHKIIIKYWTCLFSRYSIASSIITGTVMGQRYALTINILLLPRADSWFWALWIQRGL